MTIGPEGWVYKPPQTIEQAYDALRFHCERLEELLEANTEGHNDKALKRSDKAVTVMKVGFKILKKAIRRRPHLTLVSQRPTLAILRPNPEAPHE